MHKFKYVDGELHCESVRIRDVVSRVGTPVYIYSKATIVDHYRKLDTAFQDVEHLICYSLKANSNLAVCRTLADLGSGADVVSGGELFKAVQTGIQPARMVYAGVGKTRREIEFALTRDILMFNVESEAELAAINEIAGRTRRRAPVALRVNPDVDARTHRYITTGKKETKFGLDMKTAERLFLKSADFKNVLFKGLHVHIGSQITDTEPFVESLTRVAAFISKLRRRKVDLEWLNIGGGLGIVYSDEPQTTASQLADRLIPIIKGTQCKLILEPGRFIVGNAGILVTQVLYLKKAGKKQFIIVDAAMNDLIRPALYESYHDVLPVSGADNSWLRAGGEHRGEPQKRMKTVRADIVGPVCESGDFLAKDRRLPAVEQDDYLAVFSCGAYGFAMASNYNARLRPSEVLVKDNSFQLVREREKYQDLIRGERFRGV